MPSDSILNSVGKAMSGKAAIYRPRWMTIILDDDYLCAAIHYVERKPVTALKARKRRILSLAQCRRAQYIETGRATDEKSYWRKAFARIRD